MKSSTLSGKSINLLASTGLRAPEHTKPKGWVEVTGYDQFGHCVQERVNLVSDVPDEDLVVVSNVSMSSD